MLKEILISNRIKEKVPDEIMGRFHVTMCSFLDSTTYKTGRELSKGAFNLSASEHAFSLPEEALCIVADQEELFCVQRMGLPVIACEAEDAVEPFFGTNIVIQSLEEIDADFLVREHARMIGQDVVIAETEHLVLREMKLSDLETFYRLYEDEQIRRFIEPLCEDRKEEEERCKNYIKLIYPIYNFGMWTVVYKETGEVIGRVGFGFPEYEGMAVVDFGYLIDPRFRRQGLTYEACIAALTYAREESGLKKVLLYTDPANVASIRLAEKLGFSYLRAADAQNGKRYLVYERTP